MSDPQKYRTKEEVDQYKNTDSIDRMASYLMTERMTNGKPTLSEAQHLEMQAELKEICIKSVEFAENSPVPDLATELHSDVFLNPLKNMSPTTEYTHGVKNPLL